VAISSFSSILPLLAALNIFARPPSAISIHVTGLFMSLPRALPQPVREKIAIAPVPP
jgi:hypothetical protein